jgi:hypothetical protein
MLRIRGVTPAETFVTIEASLNSSEGSELIGKVAQAFGIDDDKANRAVRILADELSARIQRSMLSRGGVADVAALVTDPAAGSTLAKRETLSSPDAIDNGNHILDVLIGNKHISRKIAARTASRSNIDAGTAQKLLPAVANLVIGELQRQSQPALKNLIRNAPGLVSAGGSPLPLPGDTLPPASPNDWASDAAPTAPGPASQPSRPIDGGQLLPIPGDNIPGLGRRTSRQYPEQQNPYERLPDIVRRGGQQVPGGGGSLEDVIRSIFGSVLGSNRGIIGTMIQLFLIRWLASIARRILPRVLGGR